MARKKYYQGFFVPNFPKKYKGDVTNIVYRSGWELRLMKWLDNTPSVIEWSSEEIVIPYLSPIDGKVHRYFPDFLVRVVQADKKIKTYLVEVKPSSQTRAPQIPKRKTKKFLTEVETWGVNEAKWKQAQEFCQDRGWEFKLITERDLGL